ncbi:MAG: TSUP family transporter, partial [Bacteroidetes bacterium]|nr:TSUP family transporter [Bacteroidota bacterium]
VVIGALLSELVNDRAAALLLGIFLSLFSSVMLLAPKWKLKASKDGAVLTGGAAGFTAGLLGTGGAIRGLGLTAFGLDKASFVATSAAIDLGVDSSRLAVYWLESSLPEGFWLQLPWMITVSFGGTLAGRTLLKSVSQDQFRMLILLLVLGAGLWSLFSFFFGKN